MRLAKKFSWMTLASLGSVLVFLLAGCGSTSTSTGGAPSPAPASAQILTIANPIGSQDITTMDPAFTQDLYSEQMQEMMFPTPVVLQYSGGQLSLQPWASALPTFSSDGLTMTLSFKSGMTWSDGTPIDAQDYAYSINRALDPCTALPNETTSLNGFFLAWIKGASAFNSGTCPASQAKALVPASPNSLIGKSLIVSDPQTLQIKLAAAYQYAPYTLVTTAAMAVPQSLITKYGLANWTKNLIGFGGNVFNLSSWDHKGHMDFTANSTFWGTPKPTLQQVNFQFYTDPETAYKAYQDGQANMEYGLPPEDYAAAKGKPDFHENPVLDLGYLQPNWSVAPFNNLQARQAFDLALNKTELATAVCQGTCFASNHIIPQGQPGYNPNLNAPDGTPTLTGDQTVAKQDWTQYQATCSPKCPAITLYAPNDTVDVKLAQALQAQWQQVLGVTVTIREVTFPQLLPLISNAKPTSRPQIWSIGYSNDFPDPWDWTSLQFAPSSGQNNGDVNDATATPLMAKADTDLNPTQRIQLYDQAEQALVTDVAWITIDQGYGFYLSGPKVYGYVGNPSSYWFPGNMVQTYIAK